jgi:hypothetical protein
VPDRISGFRAVVINDMLDLIESLRPIDSASVRHEWRADGVVSRVVAAGGLVDVAEYEWRCEITGATEITITPGTVWCAPAQEIAWTSISGYSTTPSLSDGDTQGWVEVTLAGLDACTAALFFGTDGELAAALDAAEEENKIVRPIVTLTWTSSVISALVQRQLGAICVSR